jgi:hypothetical protein
MVHHKMADRTWRKLFVAFVLASLAFILRAIFGTVGFSDLLALAVVTLCGLLLERSDFHQRRLTACYELYRDYQKETEEAANRQRRTIGHLQEEVQHLTNELTDSRNFQNVADVLTSLHAEGIRELAHFGSMRPEKFEAWKKTEKEFCQRVLATMKELGCTRHEMHGFEHLGSWALGRFHDKPEVNNALSLIHARLNHLAVVTTSYAKRAAPGGRTG